MYKNQRMMTTALALSLALGATGLAQAQTPDDQLIFGLSMANVLSMDPGQSGSAEADVVRANIYDRLVQLDPDNLSIQPQLAESWDVSEDGLSYTFTLIEGATFQSGNSVTADDVVWSLRRLLVQDMSGGTRLRALGLSPENAESNITNPDAETVVLTLPERTDPDIVLGLLAENSFSVIDSDLAMENESDGDMGRAWLATNSAGSGPFSLGNWEPNSLIILDNYGDYWDGAAEMRRILFRHIPESQSQRLSLERGDIDIAFQLSSSDLDAVEAHEDLAIAYQPDGGFYFIAMSEEHERFQDARVREAIRHLVDYEGINDSILRHYGEIWQGPLAPNRPAAIPSPGWEFDPEYARALLAEAGYPDGFETTLRVLSDTPFIDIATAIQSNLSEGGIEAEIISGGGSVVYDRMRERDFDIAVGRGGITLPHPDAMASIVYNPDNSPEAALYSQHSWRTSSYNPGINRLIEAARSATEVEYRNTYYEDAQRLFHAKVPAWQPISAVVNAAAYRADLEGFIIHPTRTTRLTDVSKSR